MLKKVKIIIVTYNSEKYLLKCLNSIEKATSDGMNSLVEIIDNSADENLRHLIIDQFKPKNIQIRYTKTVSNLGFSRAVNLGLVESGFDYYILLNPDTVVGKVSIARLISCSELHTGSIIGGKTFDENGKENGNHFRRINLLVGLFDFTFIRWLDLFRFWHKWFYFELFVDKFRQEHCYEVGLVTGGYMLLPSIVIRKNKYFDEGFFMYLEDADYCMRANKIGIKTYHCKDSAIYHYSGGSQVGGQRSNYDYWINSRKYFFKKNFGFLINSIIQPVFKLDELYIRFRTGKRF